MYPDPFRFPWRTDYLEENDNMVTANITGLNFLTNRMESADDVRGASGQPNKVNLTTFGFYQDFKPVYKIHQDRVECFCQQKWPVINIPEPQKACRRKRRY